MEKSDNTADAVARDCICLNFRRLSCDDQLRCRDRWPGEEWTMIPRKRSPGFHSSSNFGATEELQWTVLTENTNNTNNSYRSSPLSNSNGLEWDGDFTSVDVSEIIAETQRLTSELDDNVVQDSTHNTVRDIENNY
ncbi:hypothetical protein AVEN_8950-1 [Araneus ventricosus]|uniref:Uncharacterized protein n=1 Tax=Araneus ventricosus TaxID=182803 RepID=A0A4Y2LM20_ARAVE|nr:hypothetical protein AVEN_8950-1 [Araneus ventricosus]